MSQVEWRDDRGIDDLIEFLHTTTGSSLRTVLYYDSQKIEQLYVRDDVKDRYKGENINRIHREQVLENINKHYVENLFNLGSLQSTTQRFDDAFVVRVMNGDAGLVISVDRDTDIDTEAVIDGSLERLEE